MLTEAQIIEGCKRGDPLAQEEFYKKFGPRMKMICLRYVRSTFEADDLFHESLIKVFNKIKTYKGEGSFSGWIRTITVNTAIDHYHRENKLKVVSSNSVEEADEWEEDDYFEKMAENFSVEDLVAIVNKLPDGYKMVFNLYAIENYSHKEVGRMLNISEGTSKSQLSKARRHLKELVLNQCLIENERRQSK